MRNTLVRAGLLATMCVGLCAVVAAQQDAPSPSFLFDAKPTPILSGGLAFVSDVGSR
jgi:hypothetical protein